MRNSYAAKLLKALFFISFLAGCNKDLKDIQSIESSSADLNSQAKRPNIILIIGDDVGREIPGYNGGQSYSTPNLDYLAANGKQFSNFLSHPDGPPSRLALVTGQYNYRNWVQFGYLPPSSLTFANMLKDRGYATCFTGKWQFDGGPLKIIGPYLYTDAHYLTDAEVKNKYYTRYHLQYFL